MAGRANGSRPSVSVIIPAFNRARLIGEAIESVLAQDYRPELLQIIVVDDGSSDGTGEVAGAYPGVTVVRQENAGPPCARNAGIARANGEWVAFLDSDDLWLPEKTRLQMDLAAASGVALVFSDAISFGQSVDTHFDMCPIIKRVGRAEMGGAGFVLRSPFLDALYDQNFVCTSSVMVRRSALPHIAFDPDTTAMEDYDLWLRLAPIVAFGGVDRVLVRKRQHRTNLTHDALKFATAASRLISKLEWGELPQPSPASRRRALGKWGRTAAAGFLEAGDTAAALRSLRVSLAEPDLGQLLRFWGKRVRSRAARTLPASLLEFVRALRKGDRRAR